MQKSEVIALINREFLSSFNTTLRGGFSEPFYRAFREGSPAEIQYRYDYIRSALHELAHWLVAGPERRMQDDFGYWYAPDGRTQEQQNEFYRLEVKPQAIEKALCNVLNINFEVSLDNLDNIVTGDDEFAKDVESMHDYYVLTGWPKRTRELLSLLSAYTRSAE